MGVLNEYEMVSDGMVHGYVRMYVEDFDRIPEHICISRTTDKTKYLLGNILEKGLLKALGVYGDMCYDWYRIDLIEEAESEI